MSHLKFWNLIIVCVCVFHFFTFWSFQCDWRISRVDNRSGRWKLWRRKRTYGFDWQRHAEAGPNIARVRMNVIVQSFAAYLYFHCRRYVTNLRHALIGVIEVYIPASHSIRNQMNKFVVGAYYTMFHIIIGHCEGLKHWKLFENVEPSRLGDQNYLEYT